MRHQKPFYWPLRVYYEDTDAAGVVYYANYLKFYERARSEWLRALGFEQDKLRSEQAVVFVVSQLQVSYRHPARFNDQLQISCELISSRAASMQFAQTVTRMTDQRLLSEATVQIVCVQTNNFKPTLIPEPLRSQIA